MRRDHDRRVPVEAVARLRHVLPLRADHPRVRLDRAGPPRARVGDAEVAALGVRVHQPRLARHRHGVEAIAAAHGVPLVFEDRVAAGARRAAPVAVVLEPAAHPVGVAVVDEDVVELRERDVAHDVEVLAAVVADLVAAVAAGEQPVAVERVDPERLVVAVHVARDALEGAAAVRGLRQPARERVERVLVRRVGEDVGVVEGPEVDVPVVVDHAPRLAVVVRAEERAGGRILRDQVDHVRARLRDADARPRHRLVRQRLDLLPRLAQVARDVEPGLPAAVVEAPRPAAERPHPRVRVARVREVDVQVRAAGVLVDVEDLLPARAAVRRLEDAALLVRAPLAAERADQRDVRIARVHHDPLDPLRALEAEVRPRRAAVGRAPDAEAVADRVARVALARAEPDDVRVRRRDGDRADRVRLLVLPLRLERRAAVRRLPQPAVGAADPERLRVSGDARDRRDSPAHVGRPDLAPAQVLQRGADRVGGLRGERGRRRGGDRERQSREDADRSKVARAHAVPPRGNTDTGMAGMHRT